MYLIKATCESKPMWTFHWNEFYKEKAYKAYENTITFVPGRFSDHTPSDLAKLMFDELGDGIIQVFLHPGYHFTTLFFDKSMPFEEYSKGFTFRINFEFGQIQNSNVLVFNQTDGEITDWTERIKSLYRQKGT